MALKIIQTSEGDESRDRENQITSYGIQYLVMGVKTKSEALDAVYVHAPKSWKGMRFSGIRFDEFKGDSGSVMVTAEYEFTGENEDGKAQAATFSFDTSGGSAKITSGIRLVDKMPVNAPDPGNFIGWNGKKGQEAEFSGVDKIVPNIKLTYVKTLRYQDITTDYIRNIAKMTGTVNSGAFKEWKSGEVLFTGANSSGEIKKNAIFQVTFNFLVSVNETSQKVGEYYVNRKGWIYLWSIPTNEFVNDKIFVRQLGIYLTKIYTETNFGMLKI